MLACMSPLSSSGVNPRIRALVQVENKHSDAHWSPVARTPEVALSMAARPAQAAKPKGDVLGCGLQCGGGGSSHPLSVTWMGCKPPTWKAETPPTKSPKNMYRKCCLRKYYGHCTVRNIWWARALESEPLENGLGGPPQKYCAKWLCYLAYVHNRVSGHGTVCTLRVEELVWQVPMQCTAQSIQRG